MTAEGCLALILIITISVGVLLIDRRVSLLDERITNIEMAK